MGPRQAKRIPIVSSGDPLPSAAVNFRQIKLSNKAGWIIHWDWDHVLSNRDSQPEDATRTW